MTASRPKIGTRPFRQQVWCCGRWDEAAMLADAAGWAVEARTADDHRDGLNDLMRRGLLTTRRHYTARSGEWDMYALTDKGFNRLAEIGYGTQHDDAVDTHEFYRANTFSGWPARNCGGGNGCPTHRLTPVQ